MRALLIAVLVLFAYWLLRFVADGLRLQRIARMTPARCLLGLLLVIAGLPPSSHAGPSAPLDVQPALPLLFEKNSGQFPPQYDFVVRGAGGKVGLSADGVTFARESGDTAPPLRIRFGGASPATRPYTKSPAPTLTHYLDARSASHSQGAENFLRVGYRSLQPGVDVEYYGNANRLEYDFLVAPGALTADLHFWIEGASVVELDAHDNLRVQRAGRTLLQHPPRVYQGEGAGRRELDARYLLTDGHRVDILIDDYDPELPLLVDPILEFATYFGGDGDVQFTDHQVDREGNVYAIGRSWASALPGEAQPPVRLPNDAPSIVFITKIAPDWSRVLFVTYISWQTSVSQSYRLAVAPDGAIYFGYNTTQYYADIQVTRPVIGPPPPSVIMPPTSRTLLGKLAPDGASLLWTTMVACNGSQFLADLAVDSQSRAILAITTLCTDHPTTPGVFQPPITARTDGAAALTAVSPDGHGAAYSLLIGGVMPDRASSVHVTSGDEVILAGYTFSPNFPVTEGAYQTAMRSTRAEVFFSRFSADGSRLLASTLFGGTGHDVEPVVFIDADGGLLAGFQTDSADLPAVGGSFAPQRGTAQYALVRMDPSFRNASWAAYLPGVGVLADVALDATGRAYFLGWSSSELPGPPLTPDRILAPMEWAPGYLGQVDSTGNALLFATALPGSVDWRNRRGFSGLPGPVTRIITIGGPNIALPVSPGASLSPGLTFPSASVLYFMRINLADPTACSVALDSTEKSIGWQGGEVAFQVLTAPGCPWMAYLGTSTLDPRQHPQVSGLGPGSLRLTITENMEASKDREFSFLINGQWAKVLQERAPCSERRLTPNSLSFGTEGGQHKVTIKVPSGCDWRVANDGLWLSTSLNTDWTYRNGGFEFTVSAGRNDFEARASSLRVANMVLPVQQQAGTCTATVNAPDAFVPAGGGTVPIQIVPSAPGCTWQAFVTPRVQFPAGASGTGPGAVSVSLPQNPANVPLTETVLVAGKSISIVQAPGICTVSLQPKTLEFGAQGGLLTVLITATGTACSWLPSPSVSWIENTHSETQGSGTYLASILPNTTGAARSGTVRLLGQTLTVTQLAEESVAVRISTPWWDVPFRANGVLHRAPASLNVPPGSQLLLEAAVPEFVTPAHELVVLSGWGWSNQLSLQVTVPEVGSNYTLNGTVYAGFQTAVTGNAPGDGSRVLVSSNTRLYKTIGDWAYYERATPDGASAGVMTFEAIPGPASRFVRWTNVNHVDPTSNPVIWGALLPRTMTAEFAPLSPSPGASAAAVASPQRVVFRHTQGTSGTRTATIRVTKAGEEEVHFRAASVDCSSGPALPLRVDAVRLSTPFDLNVTLPVDELAQLATGQYNQCLLRLESTAADTMPLHVPLVLHIGTAAIAEARLAHPVNAASYAAGPLASGSIASIFGTDLAHAVGFAESLPLPTEIHGTRLVLSQGAFSWDCPLFYVSPGQINFLVPVGVPPGQGTLALDRDGVRQNHAAMIIGEAPPSIFSADASGAGPATGHFVRVEGDTQFQGYLTGCAHGQCVASPVETPKTSGGNVYLVLYGTGIRQRQETPVADVDGVPATVVYAGPQGQFIGLDQVNILVPEALYGAGLKSLRLRFGSVSSNAVQVHF